MDEKQTPSSGAPKPAPKKKPEPKKNEGGQGGGGSKALIIILIIIILGLGGAVGYLMTQNSALQEQKQAVEDENVEKGDKIDEITLDLNAKIKDYEELMAEYKKMELDVTDLQSTLEELTKERDMWKNSVNSSKRERDMLRRKLEKVIAQAELDRIKQQEELDRLKLANDSLSSEVDTLLAEREDMYDTIMDQKEKIRIASILKAESVDLNFYSEKGKEVKETKSGYKGKSIARMTVTAKLSDNKIAKMDEKSFVMRLLEPSGTVLFDLESGGGSFDTQDGKTNFYTAKQDIVFDNTGQELVFEYSKGDAYEPGTYAIEIFADGYLAGKTEFVVK